MKRLILFATLFASIVSAQDVVIQNDALTVHISPTGAELQSIRANDTNREYLWHGDPKHWKRRALIMFPVVVRFKNNAYTYKGQHYHMPDLGLVHEAGFRIGALKPDSVSFVFESSPKTLKQYPFEFRFTVTYRLTGRELINEFRVENLGSHSMYYALGGHPGFVLPKPRENCEVTFSESMSVDRPILSEGLIQPERIDYLVNEDRLGLTDARVPDHGMLMINRSCKRIGIAEKGQSPFIEVDFRDFPNTNLWTPAGKPFVCPEPLIGHHDSQETPLAIEEKSYLTQLKGNTQQTYQFSIEVK